MRCTRTILTMLVLAGFAAPVPRTVAAAGATWGVAWTAQTDSFTSAPLVADGKVFVVTTKGSLLAFPIDCSSACDPVWTADVGPHPALQSYLFDDVKYLENRPIVRQGQLPMVYVFTNGADPSLLAFDTRCGDGGATCEPQWRAPYASPKSNVYGGDSRALVIGGDFVYATSFLGNLEAFPAACVPVGATCPPSWTAPWHRESTPGGVLTPDDHTLFAWSRDGSLHMLNASTGREVWSSAPVDGSLASVIGGDSVLTSRRGSRRGAPALYSLSRSCTWGCEPTWTASFSDQFVDAPIVADGVVYLGTENGPGSGDGHVYAFSEDCGRRGATCKPLWSGATDGEMGQVDLTLSDGIVYASSLEQGIVQAFPAGCGASTCDPLWTYRGLYAPGTPTVVDDVAYIADPHGNLVALPAHCVAECVPAWSWEPPTGALSVPDRRPAVAAADGKLFVSSTDGHVYAFERTPAANTREPGGGLPVAVPIAVVAVAVVAASTVVARRRRP